MKISAEIHKYVSIKKRRRRSAQKQERGTAHDRRAAGLVRGAMVAPVEVDDPYNPQEKIVVMRSYRDDPLEQLFAKGHIDETQRLAGAEWQRDFEAAQGASAVRAMQYKDPVDGGGQIPDPITDRQREAVKRLAACDRALGQHGSQIIRLWLGDRLPAASISIFMGDFTKAGAGYIGRRIRECLETLAVQYKFRDGGAKWEEWRAKMTSFNVQTGP